MGKKSRSGSGMHNLDHISARLEKRVKMPKFFDADPVLGSGILLTLGQGWKKLDPG
jgi:hypothetical protein